MTLRLTALLIARCVHRQFPTTLTKAQRKVAHTHATRLGMQTESKGGGESGAGGNGDRRLVVSQEPKGALEEEHESVTERLEHRWVLVYRATGSASGRPRTNMQECWGMCVRIWEQGLYLSHRSSQDDSKLYITVAANCDILVSEAKDIKNPGGKEGLPMRLQHTMGMAPFREEYKDSPGYYVEASNETNFNSAQEQRLVMSRIEKGLIIRLEQRIRLGAKSDMLDKLRAKLAPPTGPPHPVSAKFLCRLLTTFGAYRHGVAEGEFKRQCPLADRAKKLTNANRYYTVYPPEDDGPSLIDAATSVADLRDLGDGMKLAGDAAKASQKLVADTGKQTTKIVTTVVRKARGKTRRHMDKKEMVAKWDKKLRQKGVEPIKWEHLERMIGELERWKDEAGTTERFSELLLTYFPTHDYKEMQFFRLEWANLDFALWNRFRKLARNNEGKNTVESHYNLKNNPAKNGQIAQQCQQCTLWYQPIDEIRDYFGDETALYFAWLGVYTRSLGLQSIFGVVTMSYGYITTAMTDEGATIDPNRNDLTMPYSVSVAIWSVMFLQQWQRRENELRFLWGTDQMLEKQDPRFEFKGKPSINMVTGMETVVEKGHVLPFARKLLSWTVVVFMMVLTMTAALLAESVSTSKDPWYFKFDSDGNQHLDRTELADLMERLSADNDVLTAQTDRIIDGFFSTHIPPIGNYTEDMSSKPACDIMQGQCVSKISCDTQIANGDCVTHFNETLGVPIGKRCELTTDKDGYCPCPDESCPCLEVGKGCVNFGAAWKTIGYLEDVDLDISQMSVAPSTWKEAQAEYFYVIVGGLMNLVLLQSFGLAFSKLAPKLNQIENHRLQETHNNNAIVKTFVFEFVNNYFVMFYIGYIRHVEIPSPAFFSSLGWSFTPKKCDESCLQALQIKLFIVFTGKTLFKKFAEYGMPWLKGLIKQWREGSTEEKLARKQQKRDGNIERSVEDQGFLTPVDGMFDDFAQMVTQFGYLALFAPACSLAPLLAFINNVTEIRTDAMKICRLSQRPIWAMKDSIGAWKEVLSTLAFVAVLVNSTMVFFVGSQMACPRDGDDMAIYFANTSRTGAVPTFAERRGFCFFWGNPSSSAAGCPLKSEITDPGDPMETDGISYRLTVSRLWILTVAMEHLVLLVRFALSSVAPTDPLWVETAKETLEWNITHQKEHNVDGHARKGKVTRVVEALEVEAEAMFEKCDTDYDGFLDEKEVKKCCAALNMEVQKQDIKRVMAAMDTDGDGKVTLQEFKAWWATNGGKRSFNLPDPGPIFEQLDKDGDGTLDKEEVCTTNYCLRSVRIVELSNVIALWRCADPDALWQFGHEDVCQRRRPANERD